MKILTLRLKNLNSLQGEWKLDFSAEPFAGSGLFAITGPTGAGKSTLWTPSAWRFTTRRRGWTP
ncbi:AAA family ATPase [Chromobacterium haemolyticum]|nr:AAA family ATPase [Chromobacterium haemolyticum]